MKKLNVNNKDRVVCITIPGAHEFYYQPAATGERIWLFETTFSGSVFAYFRSKGRNLRDRGFSLTVKELYQFKDYRNPKLTRIMERIPAMIDYTLKAAAREAEQAAKAELTITATTHELPDELAA